MAWGYLTWVHQKCMSKDQCNIQYKKCKTRTVDNVSVNFTKNDDAGNTYTIYISSLTTAGLHWTSENQVLAFTIL